VQIEWRRKMSTEEVWKSADWKTKKGTGGNIKTDITHVGSGD